MVIVEVDEVVDVVAEETVEVPQMADVVVEADSEATGVEAVATVATEELGEAASTVVDTPTVALREVVEVVGEVIVEAVVQCHQEPSQLSTSKDFACVQ